jgi:antirestriction protein ArdC
VDQSNVESGIASKKTYQGINWLSLLVTADKRGYSDNTWGTFIQWQALGARVKKGEHASPVVFFSKLKPAEVENAEDDQRRIGFLKTFWCFNISQTEGYENPEETLPQPPLFERLERAEVVFAAAKADIRYGGTMAFYDPINDYIQLPLAQDFVDTEMMTARENFYAVSAHELSHWTGHKSRLNRGLDVLSGQQDRIVEEVIAEMSAAIICVELGITPIVKDKHAQYIQGYLKLIKADNRLVFRCATAASRIAQYILGEAKEADSP